MKITMPLFSRPLEFSELQIPVIVIENQKYFFELVSDIHSQIQGKDGDFILSESGEPVDLSKRADLIIDIFSLDCNQRKSLSLLYKKIAEASLLGKNHLNYKEVQLKINAYLQEIIDQFDYPLNFTEELSIHDLIKAADVKFNFEDQDFSEALINYLSIMRDFGEKTVFFLCNLKAWLGNDVLMKFYKDIIYRKITIVLMENHIYENNPECEICRIIDNDLCEVT